MAKLGSSFIVYRFNERFEACPITQYCAVRMDAEQGATQRYDAIGLSALRQNVEANPRIDKTNKLDPFAAALAEPIHRVKPTLMQAGNGR